MCRRFFRHDHEAIEAVNDGMLKVFLHIGSYKSEKGRFFNWVYTVVRRAALDKFKKSGALVFPAAEQEDDFPDPGADPLADLEKKDVYVFLDALSPATRVVCNLFYLEGYSIQDVAGLLGISPGTVKWHLNAARKRLRSIFERYINDCV